ncbi:MAG: terpene cyclase/mutase family protein [Planctomycetes bacterium]|nr:terpene cyclase/mutase family protein [Planctomycetota bacterium]
MSIESDDVNVHKAKYGMVLWKKILAGLGLLVLLLIAAGVYVWAFEQTHHRAPSAAIREVKPSGDKILDGINRGVEFLRVYQEDDGAFSRGLLDPKPAFTALVVDSVVRSKVELTPENLKMLDRAVEHILSKRQPDGSICTPAFQLNQYTTSICVMALKSLNRPEHKDVIEAAKQYLLSLQTPLEDGNPNSGGVGYGDDKGRVDGVNGSTWAEALKETGVEPGSEAFKNLELFYSRLQNNKETNELPAPGTEVGDDGGFFYRPGESKGDPEIGRDGKKILKSYGLMSYAALKAFILMEVSKDDPKVQSAWKWVRNNYTLDENRNIGADGLYYYYLTMAKALSAYGAPFVETPDGSKHNWARELSDRLLSLQRMDGSWVNHASSKWLESDSVMVTAFAIRTLAICREFLEAHPDAATLDVEKASAPAGEGKTPAAPSE